MRPSVQCLGAASGILLEGKWVQVFSQKLFRHRVDQAAIKSIGVPSMVRRHLDQRERPNINVKTDGKHERPICAEIKVWNWWDSRPIKPDPEFDYNRPRTHICDS
jgi:hypothetical protein